MDHQSSCMFVEQDGQIILGNTKIEIQLDRRSGGVTGLLNKISHTHYIDRGTPEVFRLVHCRYDLHGAKEKDIWSAAYGTLIHSSNQEVSEIHCEQTPHGARLELSYDRLHLEKRTIPVKVRYTIEIQDDNEETHWQLFIQNDDPGTIREAHFPFFTNLAPLDALILPNQGGQKLLHPLEKLSDETPQLYLEYPSRASMQWFEYFSASAGLYMASYDQGLSYTRLYFCRPEGRKEAAMWIVKYPFAVSDTTWESPVMAAGIHAGDWHWGADRYRNWLQTWIAAFPASKNVKEMTGDSAEILIKDEKEHLWNSYEDMVKVVERYLKYPNAASFLVAGWMNNGHDTQYPEYRPIEDLGGAKALTEAVDRVHALGAKVYAYVNARIACVGTQTYKQYGKDWAVLTKTAGLGVAEIEFAELHEDWNRGRFPEPISARWFAVMCPSVKERQDQLIGECVRVIQEYHFDGLFLDQPGSYWAELCYNPRHGHNNPATAWGPGYLELFRRVRQAVQQVRPDCVIYTEGMNDAYSQYLDFVMDKNPTWEPMKIHPDMETFVEMWRYTLPDRVTINYAGSYSYPPSQDPVYGESYLLVMGVREQAIHRAYLAQMTVDQKPPEQGTEQKRQAVLDKIQRLWVKVGDVLFYGRFMDNVGLSVSGSGVLAKLYLGKDKISLPVWNTTEQDTSLKMVVDLSALGLPQPRVVEVRSLDSEHPVPFTTRSSFIEIAVNLKAHDIDIVTITFKP